MASLDRPTDTQGPLIAAGQVSGTNVYNPSGEKLGSVYDVILDKTSGKAQYAVMSFGGFLGIGDSYFPLPWRTLTYDMNMGGYVVDIDRTQLEGAPSYSGDDTSMWRNPDYGRRVDDYYARFPTSMS